MRLAEKLRKARELTVKTGGYVFTVRRPTDLEMVAIRRARDSDSMLDFVIGWAREDGADFTEVDLGLPHGEPHPLPFDAAACAEWLADRADLFGPIVTGLVDAYNVHAEALGDARKN